MKVTIRLLSLLLACCAGVGLCQEGLYGKVPDKYACLCVTADNMNVREKPCGNVAGNAQKGRCVRFAGHKDQCKLFGQGQPMDFFQVYMDKEKLWMAGAFMALGEEQECVDNDNHDMPFPYPVPPPLPLPPPPSPSVLPLSLGRHHSHHHRPQSYQAPESSGLPKGIYLPVGACLCLINAKRIPSSPTACGNPQTFFSRNMCYFYVGPKRSCGGHEEFRLGTNNGVYVSGEYLEEKMPGSCNQLPGKLGPDNSDNNTAPVVPMTPPKQNETRGLSTRLLKGTCMCVTNKRAAATAIACGITKTFLNRATCFQYVGPTKNCGGGAVHRLGVSSGLYVSESDLQRSSSGKCGQLPGAKFDGDETPEASLRGKCESAVSEIVAQYDGDIPFGLYVPQCDDQGDYLPLQTDGSTGYRWCVDSDGVEIPDTSVPPGLPDPDCEQSGKCASAVSEIVAQYDGDIPFGLYVPQCDDQGDYLPLQMHPSTGYRWCVDSDGVEIPGTSVPPGFPAPDCGHHGKCASAVSEILAQYGEDIPLGLYVPQCDDDGDYLPLQSHPSTGYRWCVDSGGVEIPGTSVRPGLPAPDCEQSVQNEPANCDGLPETGLEEIDIAKTLTAHNKVRREESETLVDLKWDNDLASLAQKTADTCSRDNSVGNDCNGNSYDQNTFRAGSYFESPPLEMDRIVKYWAEDEKNFDRKTKECKVGKSCESWTRIVSGTVRAVGCGYRRCEDNILFVVCNYGNPDVVVEKIVEQAEGKCASAVSEILAQYGEDIPLGLYVPQCDDDGDYLPMQTHGSTGYRWCVDSDGVEIPGTSAPPGLPDPVCGPHGDDDEFPILIGTVIVQLACYLKHLDEGALADKFIILFDTDDDQEVSTDELQSVPFYKEFDPALFQKLDSLFDQDGSGALDGPEFIAMMGHVCSTVSKDWPM